MSAEEAYHTIRMSTKAAYSIGGEPFAREHVIESIPTWTDLWGVADTTTALISVYKELGIMSDGGETNE